LNENNNLISYMDYYQVLELTHDCSSQDIEQA
jgi:curved DNA-binding protein CbpA